MSEYQYYEFQAIDRPLAEREIRELRSCSTRATITPTRFVNFYDWGGLKGDPSEWMEKYFDLGSHRAKDPACGRSCCFAFAKWATEQRVQLAPGR